MGSVTWGVRLKKISGLVPSVVVFVNENYLCTRLALTAMLLYKHVEETVTWIYHVNRQDELWNRKKRWRVELMHTRTGTRFSRLITCLQSYVDYWQKEMATFLLTTAVLGSAGLQFSSGTFLCGWFLMYEPWLLVLGHSLRLVTWCCLCAKWCDLFFFNLAWSIQKKHKNFSCFPFQVGSNDGWRS